MKVKLLMQADVESLPKIRTEPIYGLKLTDNFGYGVGHGFFYLAEPILYRVGKTVVPDYLDLDVENTCSHGVNVATVEWAKNWTHYERTNNKLFVVRIDTDAIVVVPVPDGDPRKIRVDKATVVAQISVESLFQYDFATVEIPDEVPT